MEKLLMTYNIRDIQDRFLIEEEDIQKRIKENKITVGKGGALSKSSYQILLNFFSKNEISTENNKIFILNGHKINVKEKPSFESNDKRISIFHNDAVAFLKGLPSSSVDIIVTDPAYSGMNQKLKLGHGKIIGKYADAGKLEAKWFEEFHDTNENYRIFLQECYRVLKNNRHIYIMFDSYSLLTLAPIVREVFDVKNLLCWDKVNIGLGHYFRRRHEFILFASKGKRPLNSKSIPDVWKIKRVTRSLYPTQKPIEIFELMLKGSAEKDFVVCDPFLGSGSAAIASIKANCKFLGCDTSGKSIAFSKDRIEQFLQTGTDKYQKLSLLGDDEAIQKLFMNGKS